MNSCNAHAQMCRQVDMATSSRSAIARAGESARREAEDKVHMSAGGVAGNGGSPAGRINAALEKAPHFREAD